MDVFFSPLVNKVSTNHLSSSTIAQRASRGAMKIAILDDYQDTARKLDCFQYLVGHEVRIFTNTVRGVGQLSARLADIEALVLIHDRTRITAQLLDRLPNLLVISQVGKVGDHIDVAACTERGIVVLEGSESPVATAELTWALIMAAQRRIPHYVANLKQGAWQQSGLKNSTMPANFGLGQMLRGNTLGIWGYGKVGKIVAHYGRAFGMNVSVWGDESSLLEAHEDGFSTANSKAELFTQSDVLSLHLRLTQTTRGIVTREDLLQMKSTALFVNTSHAELIKENALYSALTQGHPGMAAVDVYESEPILQGYNLLRMENVICTPHIGYVERESYENYFGLAFHNILSYAHGEVINAINTQALKIYRRIPHLRMMQTEPIAAPLATSYSEMAM